VSAAATAPSCPGCLVSAEHDTAVRRVPGTMDTLDMHEAFFFFKLYVDERLEVFSDVHILQTGAV
jgi:hypothetical protein